MSRKIYNDVIPRVVSSKNLVLALLFCLVDRQTKILKKTYVRQHSTFNIINAK